jgi:hypothetical protein
MEWIRIFVPKGTRTPFFWACVVVMACNIVYYVIGIFFLSLTCRPVRKSWWPMAYGSCLSLETRRQFDYSSSCINFALDLVILATPQAIIWKLNLEPRRKIGFSLVFSLGVM